MHGRKLEMENKNIYCTFTPDKRDPVKVYVKNPNEMGTVKMLDPTLQKARDLVDGFVSSFYIPSIPNIYGCFNETISFKGKAPNFYIPEKDKIVLGNTFFYSLDKKGQIKDITNKDIAKLDKYMKNNMYRHEDKELEEERER